MADELDPFFVPVKRITAVLADPASLRATADRRTARRRATIVGLGTAAVILATVVTGFSLRHNTSTPILPAASATPAPLPSSSTPMPSATSQATPPGTAGCAPSTFGPRPYYGFDGAMGKAYHTVAVRNISQSPCTVTESPILIGVNEQSGKTEQIPMADDSSIKLITIPPGHWGYFTIQTINGFGGYDPADPQCANPRSYRDVVLVLNDSHFLLPGFSQSWKCGVAQAIGWQATSDITPLGLESRAP